MEACYTLTGDDLRQAMLRRVGFREIERAVLRRARLPAAETAADSSLFLLRHTGSDLAAAVTAWMNGEKPAAARGSRQPFGRLVPFPPWGLAVPEYLRRFLGPSAETVIAVDAAPSEIGAALYYGLSLQYCMHIPVSVACMHDDVVETRYRFFPGDFLPELTLYCLRHAIPLIPIGTPPRIVASEMQHTYNQLIQRAHEAFIHAAGRARSLAELQAAAADQMRRVFATGLHLVVEREDLISQSCYLTSRLFDLGAVPALKKAPPAAIAVMYRMTNCLDLPDLLRAFAKSGGGFDEMYVAPEAQHDCTFALTPVSVPDEAELRATRSAHADAMARLVQRFLDERMREPLAPDQIDRLTARTAEALRNHPLIQRPPGVRGTLAMRDIAQAFGLIRGSITRADLARAAWLALLPRTHFSDTAEADPAAVFKTVLSRIVYDIPLDAIERETLPKKRRALTADEAARALQGLADAAFRTLAPGEAMPVDDPAFAEAAMNHPLVQQALQDAAAQSRAADDPQAAFRDLLQELEDRGHLELSDSDHRTLSREGRSTLTEKLEEAMARGDLTPEQLAEALKHARSMPAPTGLGGDKMRLPLGAETELLAELMDYQHQGRSASSSLEDLYVHYAVNEKKGMGVLTHKVDYEKLKIMIHRLEQQGALRMSADGKRYSLSHRALRKLLTGLMQREKGQVLERRAFKKEHETDKTDVRRYRRGDAFRDISIRHSMRRILRKAKTLDDINYSDLRSFEKKPARRMDIAVCVDISESMKHSGKLRYAKLAVAELARAATDKGYRVGIVAFSNLGQVVSPLTDNITPLLDAALTLRAEQYTNIGNGLRCARRMLLKEKNSNARSIIIITDGQPNAALTDDADDTASYHARVAAFSRQTSMETKRAIGTHHALVEAGLTRRQHIKISVVYIAAGDKEDQESERTARDIARIGNGKFHKVRTLECLPLEALETVG